jgi:hypothetical protein
VKLPKERLAALVMSGHRDHFGPGHGRLMKEWIVVTAGEAAWIELAKEGCRYVKQQKP